MIRLAAALLALTTVAAPAYAIDFPESSGGYIEFTMPSDNVGCIYKDDETEGVLLECDRVAPAYVRVRMFEDGKPKVYKDVGDASCCGAENYFDYGTKWSEGPFTCASSTTGLKCTNGAHGFSMSRKAVKVY